MAWNFCSTRKLFKSDLWNSEGVFLVFAAFAAPVAFVTGSILPWDCKVRLFFNVFKMLLKIKENSHYTQSLEFIAKCRWKLHSQSKEILLVKTWFKRKESKGKEKRNWWENSPKGKYLTIRVKLKLFHSGFILLYFYTISHPTVVGFRPGCLGALHSQYFTRRSMTLILMFFFSIL